jgi:hypothetical protein
MSGVGKANGEASSGRRDGWSLAMRPGLAGRWRGASGSRVAKNHTSVPVERQAFSLGVENPNQPVRLRLRLRLLVTRGHSL